MGDICEFESDCHVYDAVLDEHCKFTVPVNGSSTSRVVIPYYPSAVWFYYPNAEVACSGTFVYADETIGCFTFMEGGVCMGEPGVTTEPTEYFFSTKFGIVADLVVYKQTFEGARFSISNKHIIKAGAMQYLQLTLEANDPCYTFPDAIQTPTVNFTRQASSARYLSTQAYKSGSFVSFEQGACGDMEWCLDAFTYRFPSSTSATTVLSVCIAAPMVFLFLSWALGRMCSPPSSRKTN